VLVRFGECELDLARSELRRAGQLVSVQPKPLALLAFLISNRHRVVSKEEILETLWPDVVVTDGSLMKAVSLLRTALGERGREGWIRSLARRGYRFAGEVIEVPDGAPAAAVAAEAENLVGRGAALEALRAAWSEAASGQGRVALVCGEPGIGKSRLAEAIAAELRARGAAVATGHCDEAEGAPPFWLWVEVLRDLATGFDLCGLAARLGPVASELDDLVPELACGLGSGGAAARNGESDRSRLFDAVARLLALAGAERPIVLVLEDLHWAPGPSLRVLEHVASSLRRHRILLIATLREEPRERTHPLARTLPLLARLPHATTLTLDRLSRDEVAELLHRRIGRPAPARLVADLLARTEGNPLFLHEALRLLEDQGQLAHPELVARWRLDQLPVRTRDVVQRRLQTLSEEGHALLEGAAVLGRSFRVPEVAALAGRSPQEALDLLDQAVAAGMLRPAAPPGSYRFAHPLFLEVTYTDLPPGRRARLHLQAADVLETFHGGARELVLSELARHLHLALGAADPDRAMLAAVEAAERARRVRAFEQAALHYEQALAALEHTPGVQRERHLTMLLALGEAHRLSGDRSRRRAVLGRALEAARELAASRDFARAAIGFCDMNEWGPRDPEGHAMLEEALGRLGPAHPSLRARVLTRLAYLLRLERVRAEPASREAIAIARETGDADSLQEALYALHLTLAGPDCFGERERLVGEMAELAARSNLRDGAFIGLVDLASDCLTRGSRSDALREYAKALALAGETPHRSLGWHARLFETGLALMDGRFDEAEQGIREALVLGTSIQHPYAPLIFVNHVFCLLRDRGGVEELARRVASGDTRSAAQRVQRGIYASVFAARLALELGGPEAARPRYERCLARVLGGEPRGIDWLSALAELAHLTRALGDGEAAERLVELLEPYAELHALMPVFLCYDAPVARSLGLLAETRGATEAAEAWYEQALAAAQSLGARPAAARLRFDLGRVVAQRGRGRAAHALLGEAVAEAQALGMAGLAGLARSASEALPAR
jgi:DNA-binding winged helix-turn-helix (wHTH) protein/tetratricopeptide (TPR) repeat protein